MRRVPSDDRGGVEPGCAGDSGACATASRLPSAGANGSASAMPSSGDGTAAASPGGASSDEENGEGPPVSGTNAFRDSGSGIGPTAPTPAAGSLGRAGPTGGRGADRGTTAGPAASSAPGRP